VEALQNVGDAWWLWEGGGDVHWGYNEWGAMSPLTQFSGMVSS
jgi:hypothetical protein